VTDLARLSTADVVAIDKSDAVVIQPIGAFEQHGPHLPLDTDAFVAESLAGLAVASLPGDSNLWVLPTLRYGKSNEHAGRAGTIALSAQTLMAVLHDVGESIAASGFRKLVFVNGHGGQPQLLELVARDIRQKSGLEVFAISALHLGIPDGLELDDEGFGVHAGQVETSLMMALDDTLVNLDVAVADGLALGTMFAGFKHLTLEGAVPTAWLTNDVSASGVLGDPRRANRELGQAVLDHLVTTLAEALLEIRSFAFPPVGIPEG
jgi:creatinine amidohydrolase